LISFQERKCAKLANSGWCPELTSHNFIKNIALKIIYLHKLYILFYKLLIYCIYIKLWCKSLWPALCSVCINCNQLSLR
jgi:hypothetical protein